MNNSTTLSIIHIIEATATGTLSMASCLANLQSKQGHKVSVIYSRRKETPTNIDNYFDDNVICIEVSMNTVYDKMRSIFTIGKLYQERKPNSVIMHSSFAGFIGRYALAISNYDVPQLIYIPHCISFMRKDIGPIKKQCFILAEKLTNTFFKSTYVPCSRSEQNEIKKFLKIENIVLIENAVNNSFFERKEKVKNLEGNVTRVITVGQIREQKNPLDFCKIAKNLGLANYEFIWVGDGDPVLKQQLINSGVRVTGWLTRDKVAELLEESEIYLSTSKWEGLPVSLIEANYAGVVVVASNCAGNVDIISDGENGYLYNNVGEACYKINSLMKDIDLRSLFSQQAKAQAISRFSVCRYEAQMQKLLDNNQF